MPKIEIRNSLAYYISADGKEVAVHAMNKVHLMNAYRKAIRSRIENNFAEAANEELAQVEDTLSDEILSRMK